MFPTTYGIKASMGAEAIIRTPPDTTAHLRGVAHREPLGRGQQALQGRVSSLPWRVSA